MTWLTWRQLRAQAWVAMAALAALAVTLAVTGPHLATLYRTTRRGDFLNLTQAGSYHVLSLIGAFVVLAVPGLIGLFWGAPLVSRELEAGTLRLAWNQSITRTRWLAIKLGIIGLAAMAAAGLFSLMVTWWSSPIDHANESLLGPAVFGERGIVPIGYAAFAFALGVTAGLLIRRTVPAMATTVAAFVAARVAVTLWVRPHLLAPVRVLSVITQGNLNTYTQHANGPLGGPITVAVGVNSPGAWIVSEQTINGGGHVVASIPQVAACAGNRGATPPCFTRLAQLGYRQLVAYQPASRFWAFQWDETAIFLALALLLAGFCFWWIRRHVS